MSDTEYYQAALEALDFAAQINLCACHNGDIIKIVIFQSEYAAAPVDLLRDEFDLFGWNALLEKATKRIRQSKTERLKCFCKRGNDQTTREEQSVSSSVVDAANSTGTQVIPIR